jgi:hypothetical protein
VKRTELQKHHSTSRRNWNMPDTIHFNLLNNYPDDLVLNVYDTYGRVDRQTWSGSLNKGQTAPIEVYANSDGQGSARWDSFGGPAGSQPAINDGDNYNVV